MQSLQIVDHTTTRSGIYQELRSQSATRYHLHQLLLQKNVTNTQNVISLYWLCLMLACILLSRTSDISP